METKELTKAIQELNTELSEFRKNMHKVEKFYKLQFWRAAFFILLAIFTIIILAASL